MIEEQKKTKMYVDMHIPFVDLIFIAVAVYLIFFGDQIKNYIGWAGLIFIGGCNTIANDIKSLGKK